MRLDFTKRPLSWSAINSFEYDKEQWYRNYILNKKDPPSQQMLLGKKVGEMIALNPLYIQAVPRGRVFEKELRTEIDGVPCVGFIDSYTNPSAEKASLWEYKTGQKGWDQNRADTHGQITMYLLMLQKLEGVNPEDVRCFLVWMPSLQMGDFTYQLYEPCEPVIFETKRTQKELDDFKIRIAVTIERMERYAQKRFEKESQNARLISASVEVEN